MKLKKCLVLYLESKAFLKYVYIKIQNKLSAVKLLFKTLLIFL